MYTGGVGYVDERIEEDYETAAFDSAGMHVRHGQHDERDDF